LDTAAWVLLGLPAQTVEALLVEADQQFGDAQSMILGKAAA